MDLDFSAEQDMLREMVRGLCASASPLDTVRDLEDDAVGYSTDLWRQLSELDLIGLMLPEEYGGSGMTALEGCVVYEEFGRALVASPHFVSAVIGAGVLLRAGSGAQRKSLLPGIVAGTEILTTGWLESEGGFGARSVRTTATADGGGFRLDGEKWHVPFASSATRIVVLARTSPADDAVDLFLVDPDATGVTMTQQFALASDNQYAVTLDGVHVSEADRIGAPGSGWATWNATVLEGAIFLAAQAIGARGPHWRSPTSTPRTGSSSTSRSARSRRSPTTSRMRRRQSKAGRSWCTKPRGLTRTVSRSKRSRRWRNSSRAGPTGT